MSNTKRMLALAAAGAAAVVLGGAFGASRHATPVQAAGPIASAIGCASSNVPTDIQFPAIGGIVSSGTQNTTPAPGTAFSAAGVAPGSFALTAPNAIVECGAVFEDTNVAAAPFIDADPTTIDGGTITYNLGAGFGPVGVGGGGTFIAQILESNGPVAIINCGSTGTPTGVTVTGTAAAPVYAVGGLNGWESCQGAVLGPGGATVTPNPGNIVHVGLRAGATFGLVGAASPSVVISATYNRFASLNAPATATPVGTCVGAVPACPTAVGPFGPATLTTNATFIGIVTPNYTMTLTPSPSTIPSVSGGAGVTPTASTITAAMFRVVGVTCVPVAIGSAANAFVVCPGLAAPAVVATALPGAEPGVITFQTSRGVFGNTAAVATVGITGPTTAQSIYSVHCGANPGTAPQITIPQPGLLFSFSFSSCTTATALLYGGGESGQAAVVANYVADYTGATATAATTVQMSPAAAVITLTRGCNEVITPASVAAGAAVSTVVGLVQGTSVVSVWRFNNATHAFEAGYFSTAGAPTDFSTTGPGQSLFICVSGNGTFPTGAF